MEFRRPPGRHYTLISLSLTPLRAMEELEAMIVRNAVAAMMYRMVNLLLVWRLMGLAAVYSVHSTMMRAALVVNRIEN